MSYWLQQTVYDIQYIIYSIFGKKKHIKGTTEDPQGDDEEEDDDGGSR